MNTKKIVVLTYGTFDNFHIGHLNILKRARKLGDKLIVGVSSDSFNEEKNKKCIYSDEIRLSIISSLKCVDIVIKEQNWNQKINDIKKYNVDIFVMGDDWKGKFDFLKEYCDVQYIPRTKNISTSKIKDIQSADKFLSNNEEQKEFVSQGTGPIDHYVFRPIIELLVKKNIFKWFSPNCLTTFGLLYTILCCYLIVTGHIYIGLLGYIFFPFIDLIDGAVARYSRSTSTVGAFYDGLVDSIAEIIILTSIGIYFQQLTLFLYLIVGILFVQLFSYRMNWIFEIKERQLNFLKIKGLKFLPVLLTRNDTRKVLLLLLSFYSYIGIVLYFGSIYLLALMNNLVSIYLRSTQGKK